MANSSSWNLFGFCTLPLNGLTCHLRPMSWNQAALKWKSLIGFHCHQYNQQKCVPVEGGLEVVNRSVLWGCCVLVIENRLDASLIFGISLHHSILICLGKHWDTCPCKSPLIYTYNPHPTIRINTHRCHITNIGFRNFGGHNSRGWFDVRPSRPRSPLWRALGFHPPRSANVKDGKPSPG